MAAAHPEVCNGEDDDGDGAVDEAPVAYGVDDDGDGAGSAATVWLKASCSDPAGAAPNLDDCDDGDAAVAPGAGEGCNGRDDDCDGAIDEGPTCEATVSVDAGSVWHRWERLETWPEAEAACDATGTHLASIDGNAVQAAVVAALAPVMGDAWVGGNDLAAEGVWTWSDGTAWGFTAWRVGQPDNGGDTYLSEECTEVTVTGAWNDRVCDVPLPFLCERECTAVWHADADGDGLGDPGRAEVDCAAPDGWVANAADCDDGNADLPRLVYADGDGDGHVGADPFVGCAGPASPGDDCDDGDSAVFPGAPDDPGDGVDQDCDGDDDGRTDAEPTAPTPSDTAAPIAGDADGDGVLDPAEADGARDDAGGAGRGAAPPAPVGCACDAGGGPSGAVALLLAGVAVRRRAGARRTCSPRLPCSAR